MFRKHKNGNYVENYFAVIAHEIYSFSSKHTFTKWKRNEYIDRRAVTKLDFHCLVGTHVFKEPNQTVKQ